MLPFSLGRLHTAIVAANALVKTAADGDVVARDAARSIMHMAKRAGAEMSTINELVRKALTGLAVGAGAAVPAAALGSYLSDRAADRASAEAQATRDFIENAAMSLAGAGLGVYALHNLASGGEPGYDAKTAAYHKKAQEELVEKFATIGAVDAMLEQYVPENELGKKIASEMIALNDAYLVRLLGDIVGVTINL